MGNGTTLAVGEDAPKSPDSQQNSTGWAWVLSAWGRGAKTTGGTAMGSEQNLVLRGDGADQGRGQVIQGFGGLARSLGCCLLSAEATGGYKSDMI